MTKQQEKKKKAATVALVIAVLFIPLLILGLIVYQNLQDGVYSGKILSVEVRLSGAEPVTLKEESDFALYLDAVRSGKEAILTEKDIKMPLSEYEPVELVFSMIHGDFPYTLYLSSSPMNCLFTGEDGVIHLIRQENAAALLKDPEIYGRVMVFASAPEFRLILSDQSVVRPSAVRGTWSHVKADGTRETEDLTHETEGAAAILPAGTSFTIEIPLKPDFINTRVNGETLDRSADPSQPISLRLPEGELTVTVECEWYSSDANPRAYEGKLEFEFRLFYDEDVTYTLTSSEAKAGGYFLLTVAHTQSAEIDIRPTFEGGKITETVDGYAHTFTIPVSDEAKPGEYMIVVLGTDVDLKLPVTVTD